MEFTKDNIQVQIDNAFHDQYTATLDLANYFDQYGTALNQMLRLKLYDYENKVVLFKNLCDQHEDTHALVNFNGKQIITVAAFSTIGDFVRKVREATGYDFPKLR